MSEPKAFEVGIGQYCEDCSPCVVAFDADRNPRLLNEKVYLKSEADKVISELKDKLRHYPMMVALLESDKKKISELKKACNDKDDWCLHTLKELRHHKYKRCLAMVKYCHESAMWLEECGVTKSAAFMLRWQKRWLELAEKFKEAK